ncbi:uncharacterized protein LOC142616510 [Castanea sativa]|uniref:uncharacterized protein LOC142616510 n=1 Tax=Castanea sativa TaxID=21020 RepID=UPI003F64D229
MTWHHDKRVDDGLLRHPADSKAWKIFDEIHESFSFEKRNVRLGLASDGFNPYGNMSTTHSTWPIVLVQYNLPSWMCMKQSYFMLALLIPGPKGPGIKIDIYFQPLIDELKKLWEVGVTTFDSSRNQNFNMRAAVLWTINDFPTYRILSGWNTTGALHRWRLESKKFDGKKEIGLSPKQLSGDDVLSQLCDLEFLIFRNGAKKRKHDELNEKDNWLKKSIFFKLPYWRTLFLRNNLDVMHIKKNVCDSIIETLMSTKKKTKDNLNSHLDLKAMGIREELHPISCGEYLKLSSACYTLSVNEQRDFCGFLKEVKFPDGYSSNIARCVNLKDRKISGPKSHDCHILLETLLLLAIDGLLPEEVSAKVSKPLIVLSNFFKALCSKVLSVDDLEKMESQISIALCQLEMIFPPLFFDVMMHLPIHLAGEAMIAGPVQYRWMYPIERYLQTLKNYVRNSAYPEGSIVEGEHKYMIQQASVKNVENRHKKQFREWFESHITQLYDERKVSKQLFDLARGPLEKVVCYNGHIGNGFRFQKNEVDCSRRTQSYGVLVKGDASTGNCDYYGVLIDIIELHYMGGNKIVMFKCEWRDVDHCGRGIMVDKYGRTLVNVTHSLKSNEPFVLACQAEQVFYVKSIRNPQWHFVIKTEPRNYYNMSSPKEENDNDEEDDDQEPYQQNDSHGHQMGFTSTDDQDDAIISLDRVDIPSRLVDMDDVDMNDVDMN